MTISLVVAASTNNVIGRSGDVPWRLADDLRRFKALTLGKPIVMGRLTYESIGRALPGRQNIVISSQSAYRANGCDVVSSAEAAIAAAASADELMVIGGGAVYRLFLPLATRIYMTRVQAEVQGDASFPPLDGGEWREVAREECQADETNDHDYAFVRLERISPG